MAKLQKNIALIEESINEKWLPICKGNYIGKGVADCALCEVYYSQFEKTTCEGCPINEDTERTVCKGTPYMTSSEDWRRWGDKKLQAKFKKAAYEMLFYLHDLAESLKEQEIE